VRQDDPRAGNKWQIEKAIDVGNSPVLTPRPFDPSRVPPDPTPDLTKAMHLVGAMVAEFGDENGWDNPKYLAAKEYLRMARQAYEDGRL